jgi:hypothetical protein
MTNILLTLTMTLAIGVAPAHQAGPQQFPNMPMMQSCPMRITGAHVSAADVENGIALTITTDSGNVAELRWRTEHMAKMHSDPSGAMRPRMTPFTAKYEEVPNGARLTLMPKDPAQLDDFRARVRERVERMADGDCSMMQGMMRGR